jgi:hypothetical protein
LGFTQGISSVFEDDYIEPSTELASGVIVQDVIERIEVHGEDADGDDDSDFIEADTGEYIWEELRI